MKKKIKEWLNLTLGVAISSFAFSFFLNPYNIVIGGVSGLGVIFKGLFGYEPALIIFLINFGLLIIGFLTIGKEFLLKTAYGSITFAGFVWLFDVIFEALQWGQYTDDLLLIIIFSSIIMGYGLGIVVKHGGSTGGTEIPQRVFYKYFHIPFSVSLYIIDGVVVTLGFFLLNQSVDIILYEIIFMAVCGVVMDTVIFSGFNKRAVYIISEKTAEIKEHLINDFARGVTGIRVVGEYSEKERKMLMCVLSTIEYYKLRDYIEKIDSTAFFYTVRANEVRGEGFTYEKD